MVMAPTSPGSSYLMALFSLGIRSYLQLIVSGGREIRILREKKTLKCLLGKHETADGEMPGRI